MATIITKNSSTTGSVPLNTQLVQGELAVNVTDKRLFTENASGTVVELGTNPSSLTLPNGTANGVPYLNGSKVLTTGSALTFDGSQFSVTRGSLGTSALFYTNDGTYNPRLAVYGSSSGTTIQNTWSSGASNLIFANGGAVGSGTEVARFDSSGNLGLGVTPSAWNSALRALQFGMGSLYGNPSGANDFTLTANSYLDSGGAFKYVASGFASEYRQSDGKHIWKTAPSGTAGNAITFTQAMTLDASGNLLVGNTSLGNLGVNSVSLAASSSVIRFTNTSASNKEWTIGTSTPGVAGVGDYLSVGRYSGSAWAEYARIDSSGNLLVGATSGSNKLTVSNGSSNAAAIRAENARNVSGDFAFVTSLGSNCNNTSSYHIISTTGGNDRFYVLGNGNVQNTNNSYGAISDAKLKDVIGAAPSYWDKFKQYQFVNYTLKSDEAKTKLLGLVAQQAQQVSPGVVEEAPDRDADGNHLGTTTLGVKYSVVTLQAEVVLQEAQARIESLEAIIEQLKADVAASKGAA